MKPDISSSPLGPTPRTDPLIVDALPSEQLLNIRAYVEQHGGTWITLADGGYQIAFPEGTLQYVGSRDVYTTAYRIQFPDGAWLTWYRDGRISPVTGWPQGMRSCITIPVE